MKLICLVSFKILKCKIIEVNFYINHCITIYTMIICDYNIDDDWREISLHTLVKYGSNVDKLYHSEDRGNIIVREVIRVSCLYCVISINIDFFYFTYQQMYHHHLDGNGDFTYIESLKQGKERVDTFLNKLQKLKSFL